MAPKVFPSDTINSWYRFTFIQMGQSLDNKCGSSQSGIFKFPKQEKDYPAQINQNPLQN